MKLEQAIEEIERVNLNKGLAQVSPVNIRDKRVFDEIVGPLGDLLFNQKMFYSGVELLTKFKDMEAPKASDYGKHAVQWLRYERSTYVGLGLMMLGAATLVTSALAAAPLWAILPTGAAFIGGSLMLHLGRYKTDELGDEFDGKANDYVKDLAKFYALKDNYTKENINEFEFKTSSYKEALDRFAWVMRKQGYNEKKLEILYQESEKIVRFENVYGEVTRTIAKSKRGPVLKFSGGISPSMVDAGSSLNIGELEKNLVNLEDWVSVSKNFKDNVLRYVKGPQLIVIDGGK
ncbi:hypothetical protein HN695_00620 [Candidatus Woesearchaeota archaeon]|jgi:hypothetical protein|nr:hypothetical protein [Candidatus Woesearchaeota archaeon]MBT5272824.1 hypothetical protein [Candidatus Woesearchaeota archaeon]MBT6040436.1 hypothetical protein [Candidatus Woesearchaeota archaeon]MBT6336931.1 hypothetical protein [Candidatus Woesearchaeota archaeon]MBT7926817.1 hypothetical protein [Candidatus Woesearchaeota archaeon]